jgi:glutamine synthetase
VAYQAEYIWLDGTSPTPLLRSKTKILKDGATPPIWGFDGSSTEQATGEHSDCVLRPVFTCPDPIRGDDNILVLAEVLNATDMKPHVTNTRALLEKTAKKFSKHGMIFGLEQEYTMLRLDGTPYGFPKSGYPGPQGPYYCGVGIDRVVGRDIIELHTQACIDAGLLIEGTNAEVMPGQWEFQIGAADPLTVSDHLWVGRWLLQLIAEKYDVVVSFDAKPKKGDWNGAGCHTNYSTKAMRADGGAKVIEEACKKLAGKRELHIANYGYGIEERLTGKHETCSYKEFRWGPSDRGASIRIPLSVTQTGKGYMEDRRPNANMDPYTVCRLIVETTCG